MISRLCLTILLLVGSALSGELKLGLIGLDTSHGTGFTKIFNDPNDNKHIPGAKVVAAFPGGSPDIDASRTRLEGFTRTLQEQYQVKMYASIEEMCQNVDAVLLTSVDGRTHPEQVLPVFKAGKKVFIDKPLAASLKEALQIEAWSKEYGVPYFSCSSIRYHPTLQKLAQQGDQFHGAIAHGPVHIEPHHPDLFWYGIHTVEALYTVMGPGCISVNRSSTDKTEIVTGIWNDGRSATLVGHKQGKYVYKIDVFGEKVFLSEAFGSDYSLMLKDTLEFFKTGKVPVDTSITLEILAFMEAADLSKAKNGQSVALSELHPMFDSTPNQSK